jgi:hypothetical protein
VLVVHCFSYFHRKWRCLDEACATSWCLHCKSDCIITGNVVAHVKYHLHFAGMQNMLLHMKHSQIAAATTGCTSCRVHRGPKFSCPGKRFEESTRCTCRGIFCCSCKQAQQKFRPPSKHSVSCRHKRGDWICGCQADPCC